MQNVMAVVSRYNSYDSFTSFYSEGNPTVPYTHKGTPLTLNTIRVRILNGDKEIVDSIGNNNAIYIEHVSTK